VLDIVHKGHLEMMKNSKAIAGDDGKLVVGILTDEAVMEKKRNRFFHLSKESTWQGIDMIPKTEN
jgi:glycerol-3-phosphate cytidylyltransferase-like family protein